jgi:hypothetical protein
MEFVLQKEGERHGRSILTPTLEIPSANYRLLGRCSSPAQNVEVRIDYDSPNASDRQTRYYRSDAGGFIEILPYRHLAMGNWSIRCYGDILDELQGRGWQKTLCLLVSPPTFDYLARLEALIQTEIEPFLFPETSSEVIQLKFADLERNSSFIFDLWVPEKQEDWDRAIELPDPATMTKTLQRLSSTQSLPPKLSKSPSASKSPQLPRIQKEGLNTPPVAIE